MAVVVPAPTSEEQVPSAGVVCLWCQASTQLPMVRVAPPAVIEPAVKVAATGVPVAVAEAAASPLALYASTRTV